MNSYRERMFAKKMQKIDAVIEEISDYHKIATVMLDAGFKQESEEYAYQCVVLQAMVDMELDELLVEFPDMDD